MKNHKNVRTMIKNGSDINAVDMFGYTPLHYAVINSNVKMVTSLLKWGCKTSIQNQDGFTPLHYAAKNQNLNIVSLLLESKADPLIPCHDNKLPKDLSDNTEIRALLSNYEITLINPATPYNFTDHNGWTSLHHAAAKNWDHVIDGLIANGANINAHDKYGFTPMHIAVQKQSKEFLIKLIEHHPNPFLCLSNPEIPRLTSPNQDIENIINAYYAMLQDPRHLLSLSWPRGGTSFHYAVYFNLLADLRNMISVAPHLINQQNNYGATPIHNAAFRNNTTAINILIDSNADKDSLDIESNSPLAIAIINGHQDAVKVLLTQKVSLNLQNHLGNTPLHLAAEIDNIDICLLLISFNANPFIRNKEEKKPSDVCMSRIMHSTLKQYETLFMHNYTRGAGIANAIILETTEPMAIEYSQGTQIFSATERLGLSQQLSSEIKYYSAQNQYNNRG